MSFSWFRKRGLGPHVERIDSGGFAGLILDGEDAEELIDAERSWRRLARCAQAAKLHDERRWAELCARRLCDIRPTRQARTLLAWIQVTGSEPESAVGTLSSIPVLDDEDPFLRETRAMSLARRGMIDDAVAMFETCRGAVAGKRPAHAALAALLDMSRASDFRNATTLVERLFELYPEDLRLRARFLVNRLTLGHVEEAKDLARVPDETMERASQAERRAVIDARLALLSHLGWMHEQFDLCESALERDPAHWSLYSVLGDVAKTVGRQDRFAAVVDAIPAEFAATPEAVSIRCRAFTDAHDLDAARRTLERLKSLSPTLFLNLRLYLALNHGSKEEMSAAYQSCLDCGIDLLGPTISYGLYLYYFQGTEGNKRHALRLFEENGLAETLNPSALQLYLRLLIARQRDDEAEERYLRLPEGLRRSARLRPFSMYFDARKGNHAAAREGWTRHIRESRHLCVNSRSRYPERVRLRYTEQPGAILAFTVVFNGGAYLDWYLRHYRALGVDHFFITDNGSTDGTVERLLAEPDVSVFSNSESFAASQFGIMWTNHLLQKYGTGHWCFHVDIDEGFVFPGMDAGRTLRDLTGYLDSRGYGSVRSFALDMYPDRLDQSGLAGSDLFEASCNFDIDYARMPSEIPPYTIFQGGVRQRMTDLALMLHKAPLVRMAPDVRYVECNHNTTHLPLADITTALLHYKFVGDMIGRLDEAVSRGEHFAGAMAYRRMRQATEDDKWSRSLLSEYSRRYTGPADLVEHGLMQSSPDWESFTAES